jgi:chromosome segregation ATPase
MASEVTEESHRDTPDAGALIAELDGLKEKLAALRAEAAEAQALSASLEEELHETRGRLHDAQGTVVYAREEIAGCEDLIAETEDRLRAARRQEALDHRESMAVDLAEAISGALSALQAYETAEEAVAALGGPSSGHAQPEVLNEQWDLLKEAVRVRSDVQFSDEVVEAAVRSRMPDAIDALPAHLREAARARIQARKRTDKKSR